MTAAKAEELTWAWIAANRWFLAMFALIIAGGVEMRISVSESIAQIREHVKKPEHDPSSRVQIETRLSEVDRRVRNVEGLATETNHLARESAVKADAVLKILRSTQK